jgi:hypothetical protein
MSWPFTVGLRNGSKEPTLLLVPTTPDSGPIWILVSIIEPPVAQSIERLYTGWTTEGWEFKTRQGHEFSLLHILQTGLLGPT